jgi:hypothetical protein
MLEFFQTNIGKMLVQLFMKNVGSTFCLKNVASTFLLKNVVTFIGKMLPRHFLNNVDGQMLATIPKNVDENLLGTIPKNVEEKNIGNVYEKC